MPASVNDYEKEDPDSGGSDFVSAGSGSFGGGGGGAPGVGSANGPRQATASQQQADSYVPWSRFVSANQSVSDREAGKLAGQVQGDVTTARKELGSAFDAQGVGANYEKQQAQAVPAATAAEPQAGVTPMAGRSASRSAQPSSAQQTPAVSTRPVQPQAPSTPAQPSQPSQPWGQLSGPPVQRTQAPQPPGPGPKQHRPPAPPAPPNDNPQPSSSNPWASFLPGGQPSRAQATQPAAATSQANVSPLTAGLLQSTSALPTAAPGAATPGDTTRKGSDYLTAGAAAGNPTGSPDLESAVGPAAWAKLIGDTAKAQNEANALGSESGVQSLLQSRMSAPGNSAFDAALINGAGGKNFQQLAQRFGGNKLEQGVADAEQRSQDAWARLQGDIAQKQAAQAAQTPAAQASNANAAPASDKPQPAYRPGDGVGSARHDLDDFRKQYTQGYNAAVDRITGGKSAHDWSELLTEIGQNPQFDSNGKIVINGEMVMDQQVWGAIQSAMSQLGMTWRQFVDNVDIMSGNELGDFWALGVVPQWMGGTGVPGEFQSPTASWTKSYGDDGGMWNAVTNMWKNSAAKIGKAAAGGPSGIIGAGVDTAKNGGSGEGLSY